jgi:peroxiredoxin Q/BCP
MDVFKRSEKKMVNVHDQAPDFCLTNQEDEKICLSDYKGKWIVLYFYPKDNTPGCTLEAQNFSKNESRFKNLNTMVVGISPDSTESHKKFQQKNDLSVMLLSDPDHAVLKDYDVWKSKKMYGKEFMGVIRSTFLIDPDGKIHYKWEKVKVPGHVEDVLTKINEMKQIE